MIQDDVLYRKPLTINEQDKVQQIILLTKLRVLFLETVHTGMTGGHLGFEKTKAQVRRRVYWPGYSKDVCRFCKTCEACARYKMGAAPKQGKLMPLVSGDTMERISIDITGPHLTSSAGHKYMLTLVDHFSKWAEAFPIRNQEANTVAKVLMDRVFCYLGTPIQILTDQGKNFESELFGELCRMMDIEKLRTTIYKPSTNGAVERFHRTLNSMIGKIIQENQRNWPNHIMYGRECRAPIDLVLGTIHDNNNTFSYNQFVQQLQEKMMYSYERVRKHLGIAAERRKRTYDLSVKPKRFEIGQRVWYYYPRRYRFKSPKWQKLYTGPHVVIKKLGDLNYVIKSCNGS